ncbi:MAG: hypothetical protein KC618_01615, partial [Candidatus Omnitrophica bacterium]|nr:hypothetical protein [Candidatus Omnitrophota bacterium]
YLLLAKEMGVNTVRTWGIAQGTKEYLDRAHELGLYVNAGIWINVADKDDKGVECSYLRDTECQHRMRKETLEYVNQFKNHPAVLFWNIGNEAFNFTKDEEERKALAHFLEDLIQEVKKIDPHHPVVYTSASTSAISYIKQYVPGVDIFGVNVYSGMDHVHNQIIANLDIPYFVTEYGPLGSWQRSKDFNDRPIEVLDQSKANSYRKVNALIDEYYGYCLGGFVFYLGESTESGYTWWNLTYKQFKKLSYRVMQEHYTEKVNKDPMAHIISSDVSPRKHILPGENISVKIKVNPEGLENVRYHYFLSTDRESILEEFPNRLVPVEITGTGAEVQMKAPEEPGVYRLYMIVITDEEYASTASKSISIEAAVEDYSS